MAEKALRALDEQVQMEVTVGDLLTMGAGWRLAVEKSAERVAAWGDSLPDDAPEVERVAWRRVHDQYDQEHAAIIHVGLVIRRCLDEITGVNDDAD